MVYYKFTFKKCSVPSRINFTEIAAKNSPMTLVAILSPVLPIRSPIVFESSKNGKIVNDTIKIIILNSAIPIKSGIVEEKSITVLIEPGPASKGMANGTTETSSFSTASFVSSSLLEL